MALGCVKLRNCVMLRLLSSRLSSSTMIALAGASASMLLGYECMTECFWCGTEFDGTYYRWLCPTCGAKANCCEGEPCRIE